MALRIQIPPDLEARLREKAAAAGELPESFILNAIQDKLTAVVEEPVQNHRVPHERWMSELRSWVSSHCSSDHVVDDSRETIYGNRGQ